NQVERSLRQCGFVVVPLTKANVFVNVHGLSHGNLGYSAGVHIQAMRLERIRGEDVFIEAMTESTIVSGPPGGAAGQIRSALDELLDSFCNSFLEAKAEVRGAASTKGNAASPGR